MFQRSENGFGQAGLTLTLNRAHALPDIREGLRGRIDQMLEYVATMDLVPDLGANVGSTSWFRGLLIQCYRAAEGAWTRSHFEKLTLDNSGRLKLQHKLQSVSGFRNTGFIGSVANWRREPRVPERFESLAH